ncbi:MAG: ATP-binding cassette domain-containing protein [Planctomycetaceae bacterium]|jgi:excinuclease ABC subunit A|nr:ATP-binding cassette domain-containing protein [Planctomycetaceae bacterium]
MIRVRGARVHNLKEIDVDIPRDRLVAVTGVSGSGKSTLAFDVIFAEGQRRFLQGLSPGQRGRLDRWERADVDRVEGLPAAVCIDQRSGSTAARSTLATTTEIHNYLRLLFARVGTVHCPHCGQPLESRSPQAIVDVVLGLGERRRVMLLAPIVARRRGAHRKVFEQLGREGFVRARVDGELREVADPPELDPHRMHSIDVVVDRVVIRDGLGGRLQDSVELALRAGDGRLVISAETADGGWDDTLLSSKLACAGCEWSAPTVEPRTLSFNSPEGACQTCRGLGRVEADDDDQPAPRCPACQGTRLGELARAITISGTSITGLCCQTVAEAHETLSGWLNEATETGDGPRAVVTRHVLPHVVERLKYLQRVGLDYLSLDRPTRTLSGGEFQRARLAGALGSGLVGVGYVLDEPTIGLHAADTSKLISCLEDLRDQGNSVLVVEHDLGVLRQADWVVDLGPGGGRDGGQLLVSGPVEELTACRESLTGAYLADRGSFLQRALRAADKRDAVELLGANCHNLQDVCVHVPLGVLCAVTGVSGSGKTSLVSGTLVPVLQRELTGVKGAAARRVPAGTTPRIKWHGERRIERVVCVDQSQLGRSPRSTPATFTKIWDEVRKVFARTRAARSRGFGPRRFSFNVEAGRCQACRGRGHVAIEMQFLPDMVVPCPECGGKRFNPATLRVRYRGRSVADVLAMTSAEAVVFFENFPKVVSLLQTLVDVGLGYLVLGQSTATLSGGEAQRVRLAAELGRPRRGQTLYVLDEPTTGLHAHDVSSLLQVLDRLVENGHSVVIIEHHPELIAATDWVIDLGPGGGSQGGRVVAEGPPQAVAAVAGSATGRVLAEVLAG